MNDLKQPPQKVVCRERPPQVIVSMKFRLAVYFSSNLLIQFYLNSFFVILIIDFPAIGCLSGVGADVLDRCQELSFAGYGRD